MNSIHDSGVTTSVCHSFQNIPADLTALNQWVCWHYEERDGKPTKPPIQAKSNGKLLYAESNNPATWSDFATAAAAADRLGLNGIGLNVWADDNLTGLDLDHVFDPETGELDPLAIEVMDRFAAVTYCEISPSGHGIRIWCKGKPQRSGKCTGKVKWLEVYSHPSNRYLTVTGNQWPGSADHVTEQQDALDWLHTRFMAKADSTGIDSGSTQGKGKPRSPSVDSALDLDDAALLDKARNARNGAIFEALYGGDRSGHGNDASSADLALLNLLAFWTDRDAARMDRLFRQSGLMRDKWDVVHDPAGERTYGQMSIAKAIADCRDGYSGTKKPKDSARPAGAESAGLKILGAFNNDGLICIATDEKSAAGIFEHSHIAVVVAGSAQRLWQAAQDMRRANPRLKILVCGDADSADKARIAAFALIGGSYWCAPNFLQPGRQELQDAAIALMKSPPAADDPIPSHFFKEAAKALSARDQQRVAEESPSTFADLTGWESGAERVAQRIQAAVSQIGVIKIRPGKLPSIVDRAEKEALFLGADFYQRVGMLVRPVKQDVSTGGSVRIPAGALVLNLLNTSWLNRRFSQSAKWVKFNKETGDWLPADPPTKYADTLLAMAGEWRAPVLTGIVECPTLRRDGSLLTTSGYDSESGLYVDYHGDPICVPDAPTQADALAALAILKEPFTEFPFAEGDIDLAVALSGLLTAVVRRSLRTAPLFAFDAPVMGAGKGLIVNTIATVATGRAAPAISQGKDEAEDEKRLGALLLQGVPLLNIDNIERDLQGDLLCSALTETTIAIRILGKSEVPNMPSNVAMFATGNNLRARGDMVRRMLVCRIDPACERPDARSFKRNLNEWVPANRARLLSAALTVLRAYIVAGKPKQDIPPYGSFEEWSGLVRSSLVWLGMPDPNLTRVRLEAEDAVTINLHSILTLWFAAFGKNGMTAAEVATQAGLPGNADLHRALLEVAVSRRDSEKVDAFRLGHWLKKQKGKVANGLKLEKAGEDSHSKLLFWRVVNLQSAKSAGNAGNAGKDFTETRENWKTSQNASESNFSRDWREQYPQYPHYPQNPPASPPVVSPDATALADVLATYRGWALLSEVAKKAAWPVDRTTTAAHELATVGMATISGTLVKAVAEVRV